eukprot:CAMPEP_0114555588 /NCGR_PEP_ID=MMETSP0114-20121206/8832_1 /TAXON_ID=31324 /ORGANISM="Goniomonas sp, Strain m" /LENGTH=520 /DNA_ID=CAMNT_0001740729 /DNA_START=18 /DNA_END=1580 /DNA_ORIENTATION=-
MAASIDDTEFFRKAALAWKSQWEEFDFWVEPAQIEGQIPRELHGTFFRNGPGNNEVYGVPLMHPIDGDGLVCAVTFTKDGRVHFRSRYTRTKNFVEEQREAKMIYRGQMGTNPPSLPGADAVRTVANLVTRRPPAKLNYKNASNTNVFYWGGKLLSLWESGVPYNLDPHTLETVGPETFNGRLKLRKMAAHFRYDALRNRLVTLSVAPALEPAPGTVHLIEWDQSWNLLQEQTHQIAGLNYGHDFLLSPNYYILHMTPFVSTAKSLAIKIMMGITSPGESMRYHPELPSRLLVIPRDPAKSHLIRQFEVPPVHIFHFATCHEERSADGEEVIVFTAACLGTGFNMTFEKEVWLSNANEEPARMFEFKVDLTRDRAHCKQIDRASVEFPTIHPDLDGLPCKNTYMMACDTEGQGLPYQHVVKLDVTSLKRQVWLNPGGLVCEPTFIPRVEAPGGKLTTDEDDGWVIVQVYDVETQRTDFVLLDAKRVDAGPIARIKLPVHIPLAFHGTWCPETFVHGRAKL